MDRRIGILVGFAGVLAIVVLAIVLARGGGDDDKTSSTAASGEKPTVEVPDGPAPDKLVSTDLTVGDGAEAKSGDQISVNYVGVDFKTGEEFDNSFDRGQPFDLQLGGGSVIPGWDQGIVGMKVGGRRQLVIPPDLAYGAQGQPPSIGPNATLVFDIDLLSVN